MKCPACNATNPDNATYCKSCGKALNSNLRKCPNGHDYDASLPSCPHCPTGRNLTMGSMPTAKFGADTDKTKVDNYGPRLQPGMQTTKPAAPPAHGAPDADRTVILKPDKPANAYPPGSGPAPTEDPANLRPQPGSKLTGWLVTFSLDPLGKDFRIVQGRHKIGSGRDCDIVIDVAGVSELHAILLSRNDKFIIEDNLSSNGTFVNGEMIEDKVYLNENDVIRIATVDLKLKLV